jgi:hypothetical protein
MPIYPRRVAWLAALSSLPTLGGSDAGDTVTRSVIGEPRSEPETGQSTGSSRGVAGKILGLRPSAFRMPRGLLAIFGIAALLRIVLDSGYVAYDGMYSLVWGRDLTHGRLPDFTVPIAPTPHPLFILVGAMLSPFGQSAPAVFEALILVSFAVLGWVAFELGRKLFSVPVGVLFAVILLTRKLLVIEALQASQDIPFMTLVFSALLLEVEKPKRGLPVLGLLAAAGLLRPEAWLLSVAYLAYLAPRSSTAERLRFAGVALSAPLVWASLDLVVTGDPVYSLHGTQDLAAQLHRPRELDTALQQGPLYTRLILHNPIMWLGIAGVIVALYALRRRSILPTAVGALGVGSFLILGVTGLPLLIRYLLVPAAILGLFCAVAVFGWLNLARGSVERALWLAVFPILLLTLVLSVPDERRRVETARLWVAAQRHAQDTLHSVMDDPVSSAWMRRCHFPVYVPNHRVVPLLAFWRDAAPASFLSVPQTPARGLVITPANSLIAATLILDPHEPRPGSEAPIGFHPVRHTEDWVIYARC